jgi:RNA polymerase sigma-70 factor (ECF subfamily)
VCLDLLRSRERRREDPIDVRVPEPLISPDSGVDPGQEALLADSVGLAMLVVLETLAPAERLAFVLHDLFAVPFDEIAPMIDKVAGGRPAAGESRASSSAGPGAHAGPGPDASAGCAPTTAPRVRG